MCIVSWWFKSRSLLSCCFLTQVIFLQINSLCLGPVIQKVESAIVQWTTWFCKRLFTFPYFPVCSSSSFPASSLSEQFLHSPQFLTRRDIQDGAAKRIERSNSTNRPTYRTMIYPVDSVITLVPWEWLLKPNPILVATVKVLWSSEWHVGPMIWKVVVTSHPVRLSIMLLSTLYVLPKPEMSQLSCSNRSIQRQSSLYRKGVGEYVSATCIGYTCSMCVWRGWGGGGERSQHNTIQQWFFIHDR